MARKQLSGIRVAALAANGFEQVELTIPMKALQRHGADVTVISLKPGSIRGMNLTLPGRKVEVDETIYKADPDDYDALLLPGGFISPDFMRQSNAILNFVRAMDRDAKPIATLCHGPWVLASAGLTEGRTLTSWPGIQDDVRNAGGDWKDAPVVEDRNWISSRSPIDLPYFVPAMIDLFEEQAERSAAKRRLRRVAPIVALAAGAAAFARSRIAAAR